MTIPIVDDAYGWDRAFAAMFLGAKHGETSSQMFGIMQEEKKRLGCWMCAFLSIAVEKNHCQLAITVGDGPTSGSAAYRAGIALLFLFIFCMAFPVGFGILIAKFLI